MRYGRMWMEHQTDRAVVRVRTAGIAARSVSVPGATAVASGAALAASLAAGARTVVAQRVPARPRPMDDGALLATAVLTGLGALVVAVLLGFSLAGWMATTPHDAPAVVGGVAVGAAFLGLGYLVFASHRRRGETRHAKNRSA
ncbi:hypothetical protein Nans01_33140 [Nocardiopsis ansamitocini]|uniref:Transmembrane protein n=2 Tax=Nocardiopsis ansamitocini TaxID=1670832 RepID=A0A9W6UJX5_9ACTN|nr:hypothetical protein Nans01_33140 [Nocardiopsis ansamitocini]